MRSLASCALCYMHAHSEALRDFMGVRWHDGVRRTDDDPVRRMQLSASGLLEYVIGTRDDGPDARTALSMSEHSLRIALDLAKERRPDGTYNSSKDERVLLRRRLARSRAGRRRACASSGACAKRSRLGSDATTRARERRWRSSRGRAPRCRPLRTRRTTSSCTAATLG